MISHEVKKPNPHLVGSIGSICYQLAKRGWNVKPTSRNAKGIDILIYSQDAIKKYAIQVKSLSKKVPVPLGDKEVNTIALADYVIICVLQETQEMFIAKPTDLNQRIHRGERNGEISYWLQPKGYVMFKDNWHIIGDGL
ncbi:MAG TPA: hypothetical protein VFI73_12050 [Candidatus Nitrosopolaris sp.]|nr:hypothetical protein [Candidatus Nitrosopolaris sp.]